MVFLYEAAISVEPPQRILRRGLACFCPLC